MRNSVLCILGEIIIKGLNNDDQSTQDLNLKQIRNDILDLLCDHIHDLNALTRSKTLQIWRKICEENKLPLQYQNEIMKRCVGRMDDSASSVRKSAFQLLCDLIKKNPYGIKNIQVSLVEIEEQYKKEVCWPTHLFPVDGLSSLFGHISYHRNATRSFLMLFKCKFVLKILNNFTGILKNIFV
jgi:hypothetical protein